MEKELPLLSAEELRVLGTLIEKSITTPDYYPMTLNSLTAGCNQKSSRKPVVDYSETEVNAAISKLKGQSLVATAVGAGSRVIKFKHNFGTVYPISDAEIAILCLLFLRGPQTPGELNTNSGRMYEFSSLESVLENLNKMMEYSPPMIKELERQPGQKEVRYAHLFGALPEFNNEITEANKTTLPSDDMQNRLCALEQEVATLREIVDKLVKELMG